MFYIKIMNKTENNEIIENLDRAFSIVSERRLNHGANSDIWMTG